MSCRRSVTPRPCSTFEPRRGVEATRRHRDAVVVIVRASARVDGVDSVSGKVSKELGWTAFKALGFASLAISIFIWRRSPIWSMHRS